MSPSERHVWQSLEERAGTIDLAAEEPHPALRGGVDRRRFLQLMGASIALAGGGGCFRQPSETVVPQVRRPRDRVPGQSLYFATAIPLMGFGTGVLVESHDGRPTKVEGNPAHPASLGATDAIHQATVLGLYDPDRSQVVTNGGQIRPWSAMLSAVRAALEGQREGKGAGLRIVTETVTSPTLAARLRDLLAEFPRARWVVWEPAGRDAARAGARQAFGEDVETRYRVDKASVVVSLDADFLTTGPGHVRYAREFGRGRKALGERETMNRLWVAESMPTITGASADRRIVLRAADVERFARAVAAGVGVPGARAGGDAGVGADVVDAVVKDLRAHRGSSLVVPGDYQPASLHALAHALNEALGNVGRTVEYSEPVEAAPAIQADALRTLADEMDAGAVQLLLVLGGNPVLTAPADLRFAERMGKVPMRVHLGLYEDETAELCHWHVPESHYLESWGDVRAYDGTASIIQPLIAPLYAGRTALGLLAAFAGDERSDYDLVRAQWQRQGLGGDFEAGWRRALHDGVVTGTALPASRPRLRDDWAGAPPPPAAADAPLEIVFRPDAHVLDGRFANNGWLMELPRPVTKLTWDNAALLAPATAARLGVANEDVVEVAYRDRTVRVPAWIVPGHAPDSVTLQLGYGRTRGGAVARGAGVDVYPLRTSDTPWMGRGATIRSTGTRYPLATTQGHQRMEGRDLIRVATLEEYREHPGSAHEEGHGAPAGSLYPPHPYPGHAWGMAIDLASCIGCQACVVACQSENNIPVVGKVEVARGREMHWIRVDRYFEGGEDDPGILHQPVPCMHCEHAPCEVVCPVNATTHSSEGLNDMVYNRCVGTRYCSNNCPYKVRRFNFFVHANWDVEVLKMAQNPDVTVRSRGVMEKCTYCVQRIEEARAQAIVEGRPIRDGDIVTACQQVCPTEAIVFGDVNDPESRVAKRKAEERNYALLGELGTRPRTTYLAKIRNPGGGHEG
jgi:molybdopterin-containing oxidoreductase family iron-sulfur binding subunit